MPAAPADSALYRDLFADLDSARLFSDAAELRAMLLVAGALARVQGDLGLIPLQAAGFIERSAREVQLDPSAMAAETAKLGDPVPAFLAAFRKAAEAPDLMHYLHWGAQNQDLQATAQALRLRRVIDLWQARLEVLIAQGFDGLRAHQAALSALRPAVEVATLSGDNADVAAALAAALGLHPPGTEARGLATLTAWMAGVCGCLADDLDAKAPLLRALARQVTALSPLITEAAHTAIEARFAEWLALAQLVLSTGRALALAVEIAAPDA